MISYSTKFRSSQAEIMDDFHLQGKEMEVLLTDLRRVNQLLGGNAVTLNGIETLLETHPLTKSTTILDVGCGDGQLLRQCAKWAKKKGRTFDLIGVDGNAHILSEARKRTPQSNIRYEQVDAFAKPCRLPEHDIAICTLFLHHFKNPQIVEILERLSSKAKVGVVINDLHRSRWAFWLFKLFSVVMLRTKTARHDGLVSVARGFKRKELNQLSEKIKGKHIIRWMWAFRFQWIIK